MCCKIKSINDVDLISYIFFVLLYLFDLYIDLDIVFDVDIFMFHYNIDLHIM